MIKRLTINARKPRGLWGRLMIRKMNLGHAELTKWALGLLAVKAEAAVLDVGCGGGKAVRRTAQLTPRGKVCGIDYSELSVRRARRENRRAIRAGRVEIRQASVSELPFADNSFDCATAIETIYFWPSPKEDLQEVLRVLKPGGRLAVVCEMVHREGEPERYAEAAALLNLRVPSAESLKGLLRDAGFQSVQAQTHRGQGWLCVIGEKKMSLAEN